MSWSMVIDPQQREALRGESAIPSYGYLALQPGNKRSHLDRWRD
jgi:hypothetical protein